VNPAKPKKRRVDSLKQAYGILIVWNKASPKGRDLFLDMQRRQGDLE
jgi:hypothetical protein